MGNHFASRLVIRNDPGGWWVDPHPDRLAVDLDVITKLDSLPNVCWLIVDRDAPFNNKLLHLKTGSHARLSQHLVQFGRLGLGLQHAFLYRCGLISQLGVELARDHITK